MKRLFTNITSVWLSSLFFTPAIYAFQTEPPADAAADLTMFERLEAGLATPDNVKLPIYYLGQGDYAKALENVRQSYAPSDWLRSYLEGLTVAFGKLKHVGGSEHFEMWVPADQEFLADYALPSLEKSAAYLEKTFGHRPQGKIRVEIYPTKEDFSAASTLSLETLERSGAIGICKFHRLMIMSPKALPLGYRWLDALSHEYLHLNINELSYTRAELWLHEGTARYFETAYREDPPAFLTPDQKTKLLEALEKDTLVPFARMSPSMVYLKDQEEVSLAFSQVAHAVSVMMKDKGPTVFVKFLVALQKSPFQTAFKKFYGMDPSAFEKKLRATLASEPWKKSKGTMSDEVHFKQFDENAAIGADAQGQVRLGDRMRKQNLFEAALIQYEKALDQEPDNAIILLKAARMHLALGQTEDAIKKLRHATEKNPNYITPHIELAFLVDAKEAVPHLFEALAINPFDPRIHERLIQIYAGDGTNQSRESNILNSLK